MSEQNVTSFFEKLELDKGIQQTVQALAKKHKAHQDVTVAELIAIATRAGFPFTAADFAAVREKASASISKQDLMPVGTKRECNVLEILFGAPCTCGYTTPCRTSGLA